MVSKPVLRPLFCGFGLVMASTVFGLGLVSVSGLSVSQYLGLAERSGTGRAVSEEFGRHAFFQFFFLYIIIYTPASSGRVFGLGLGLGLELNWC